MKEINQIKTVYKVKVYGDEFELRKPNLREVKDFNDKITEGKESEIDLSVAFLETLGIPSKTSWDMEPQHINELVTTVCGAEKK